MSIARGDSRWFLRLTSDRLVDIKRIGLLTLVADAVRVFRLDPELVPGQQRT